MKAALWGLLSLGVVISACGEEEKLFSPEDTLLIKPEQVDRQKTPTGSDCLNVGDQCLKPQELCGQQVPVDILVDEQGQVVEVVCYKDNYQEQTLTDQEGTSNLSGNHILVTPGSQTIKTSPHFMGNKAVLYGKGPQESIIEGDLTVSGNNAKIRGVTIKGNVSFMGNESQLMHCIIEGDVSFRGNGNLLSHCVVFGKVSFLGNENRVHNNYLAGALSYEGDNWKSCAENRTFVDGDMNLSLSEAERMEAKTLACP